MEPTAAPSAAELRALLSRERVHRYEIAPELGMHPHRVGRLLNGREPLTPELAQRIAAAIEQVIRPTVGVPQYPTANAVAPTGDRP